MSHLDPADLTPQQIEYMAAFAVMIVEKDIRDPLWRQRAKLLQESLAEGKKEQQDGNDSNT